MMGLMSWIAWLRIKRRLKESCEFCRKAEALGNGAWGEGQNRLGLDSYSSYPTKEEKWRK